MPSQVLTASDSEPLSLFGSSVDVDGRRAVVGASFRDLGVGAVYTFVLRDRRWTEEQIITTGASGDEWFGASVSVDGDRLIAGAPRRYEAGTRLGGSEVWRHDGNAWIREAVMRPPPGYPFATDFGEDVALEDDVAVVGAPGEGRAYVYRRVGVEWTLEAELDREERGFGASVAVSGNSILVGAADAFAPWAPSAAHVFVHDGQAWVHQATLDPQEDVTGQAFGADVALQGDMAVVSASGPLDTGNVSVAGEAFVFERVDGAWVRTSTIHALDDAPGSGFGAPLALDGATLVVGAPLDDALGSNVGAAHVFKLTDAGWQHDTKLAAMNGSNDGFFGNAVAVDGKKVLVGHASDALGGGFNDRLRGSVSVFQR